MKVMDPVRAARIDKLVDLFSALSVDEVLTRDTMHKRIKDLDEADIQTAKRKAQLENGVIYATVRGVGYIRSPSVPGVLDDAEKVFSGIGRKARRAQKLHSKVVSQINDISDEDRRVIGQNIYTLGLIRHNAAKEQRRSVHVEIVERPVPVEQASADMIRRMKQRGRR